MALPQTQYQYGPEHGTYTYFFRGQEKNPDQIQVDLPFNKQGDYLSIVSMALNKDMHITTGGITVKFLETQTTSTYKPVRQEVFSEADLLKVLNSSHTGITITREESGELTFDQNSGTDDVEITYEGAVGYMLNEEKITLTNGTFTTTGHRPSPFWDVRYVQLKTNDLEGSVGTSYVDEHGAMKQMFSEQTVAVVDVFDPVFQNKTLDIHFRIKHFPPLKFWLEDDQNRPFTYGFCQLQVQTFTEGFFRLHPELKHVKKQMFIDSGKATEVDTEVDISQFAISEIEGKCGELSVERVPAAEPAESSPQDGTSSGPNLDTIDDIQKPSEDKIIFQIFDPWPIRQMCRAHYDINYGWNRIMQQQQPNQQDQIYFTCNMNQDTYNQISGTFVNNLYFTKSSQQNDFKLKTVEVDNTDTTYEAVMAALDLIVQQQRAAFKAAQKSAFFTAFYEDCDDEILQIDVDWLNEELEPPEEGEEAEEREFWGQKPTTVAAYKQICEDVYDQRWENTALTHTVGAMQNDMPHETGYHLIAHTGIDVGFNIVFPNGYYISNLDTYFPRQTNPFRKANGLVSETVLQRGQNASKQLLWKDCETLTNLIFTVSIIHDAAFLNGQNPFKADFGAYTPAPKAVFNELEINYSYRRWAFQTIRNQRYYANNETFDTKAAYTKDYYGTTNAIDTYQNTSSGNSWFIDFHDAANEFQAIAMTAEQPMDGFMNANTTQDFYVYVQKLSDLQTQNVNQYYSTGTMYKQVHQSQSARANYFVQLNFPMLENGNMICYQVQTEFEKVNMKKFLEACNQYINTIGWKVKFENDNLVWECTTENVSSLFYIQVSKTSQYYPLFMRTNGLTGPMNMSTGDECFLVFSLDFDTKSSIREIIKMSRKVGLLNRIQCLTGNLGTDAVLSDSEGLGSVKEKITMQNWFGTLLAHLNGQVPETTNYFWGLYSTSSMDDMKVRFIQQNMALVSKSDVYQSYQYSPGPFQLSVEMPQGERFRIAPGLDIISPEIFEKLRSKRVETKLFYENDDSLLFYSVAPERMPEEQEMQGDGAEEEGEENEEPEPQEEQGAGASAAGSAGVDNSDVSQITYSVFVNRPMKQMPNAVLNAYEERKGQLEKLNPNVFVWQKLPQTRHLKFTFDKFQVKNGVFKRSDEQLQDTPNIVMRMLVK